jgi:lysophospholipase L1-like esterase
MRVGRAENNAQCEQNRSWSKLLLSISTAILLALLALALLATQHMYVQKAYLLLHPVNASQNSNGPIADETDSGSTVVFFGDSRVRLWEPRPHLRDSRTIWRGVNGQTTAQMRYRFPQDVIAHRPRVVVLQAGINDLVAGVATGQITQTLATASENVHAMIQAAVSSGSEVVLITVVRPHRPPLWRWPVWSRSMPNYVDTLNTSLKGFASEHVRVLDADTLLAANEDYLPGKYAADTLHFNHAAYEVINDQLTNYLDEILNAVQ